VGYYLKVGLAVVGNEFNSSSQWTQYRLMRIINISIHLLLIVLPVNLHLRMRHVNRQSPLTYYMPATSIDYVVESFRYAIPFIFLPWVTWTVWKFVRLPNQHSLRSVAIVVLGDIGRSPRMMYHAKSFAENGFVTDIIAYGGLYLGHY
jgi:hypothetical protein